jgi:Uma2 family endonuclease
MLIQEQPAQSKQMTLEEFLDWYPEGQGRFELHDGGVIEMQATGTDEQVGGFLALKVGVQIERLALPYFIPRQGIIKAIDSDKSGYRPEVMVLDWQQIETEPMWKKRSTITRGETIRLVIEIVSTNWQDHYLIKLGEYEKLAISEYWIVDYLGLGGRRYIGNPKQPTISVNQLVDGEYVVNQFRGDDVVRSLAFPDLNLTAEQIFQVGQ